MNPTASEVVPEAGTVTEEYGIGPLHSARRRPTSTSDGGYADVLEPIEPTALDPEPGQVSDSDASACRGRSRPSSGRVVGDERRGRFPCSSRGACCTGPRPGEPRDALAGAVRGPGRPRAGSRGSTMRDPRRRAPPASPSGGRITSDPPGGHDRRRHRHEVGLAHRRQAHRTRPQPVSRWASFVSVRRVPHHLHVERRIRRRPGASTTSDSRLNRVLLTPERFIRFGRGAWDHSPLAQHLPGCPCGLGPAPRPSSGCSSSSARLTAHTTAAAAGWGSGWRGQEPGGAARRVGRSRQRRTGPRQRVHHPAAGLRGGRGWGLGVRG